MFTTFLKESENEADSIKARALNNRGHAKYMQVEFEAALKDYNEALEKLPDFAIGNVQLFVNLIFILYAGWRFKIVCLQTKLASLAIRKKSNFYRSKKSNFYGF